MSNNDENCSWNKPVLRKRVESIVQRLTGFKLNGVSWKQ